MNKDKMDFESLFEANINKILRYNNNYVDEIEVRSAFSYLTQFEDNDGFVNAITGFLMVVQSFDFKLKDEISGLLESNNFELFLSNDETFDSDTGSDISDKIYDELKRITDKINPKNV